ncbi:MAG: T9SS type A sorting domain-containing protein [Bacteroidales bacterium]|nr:T9SS type A sorting domain-containing protein [Bacteroidales bacterium]
MNQYKIYGSLVFLFITLTSFAQTSNSQVPGQSIFGISSESLWSDYGGNILKSTHESASLSDSIHISNYDTTELSFQLAQRTFISYDSGGMMIQRMKLSKDKNGFWKNYSNDTLVYIGLQLRKVVSQQWDNQLNSWKNALKFDYSYDTLNVLTNIIMSTWNAGEFQWTFSEKQSFTYTGSGLVNIDLLQAWNGNLSTWENRSRTTHTYANSLPSNELYEQWDPISLSWLNYTRSTLTYSSGKLSRTIIEKYLQALSAWENASKNEYSYNADGKLETDTQQLWSNAAWVNSNLLSYTYNSGNLVNLLTKKWQPHLNDWRNSISEETYFSSHEVFGIYEKPESSILALNPVSKSAPLRLIGLQESLNYQVTLTDMNGRNMFNQKVKGNTMINLPGNLNNGIYILRCINPAGNIRVQKVLLTD